MCVRVEFSRSASHSSPAPSLAIRQFTRESDATQEFCARASNRAASSWRFKSWPSSSILTNFRSFSMTRSIIFAILSSAIPFAACGCAGSSFPPFGTKYFCWISMICLFFSVHGIDVSLIMAIIASRFANSVPLSSGTSCIGGLLKSTFLSSLLDLAVLEELMASISSMRCPSIRLPSKSMQATEVFESRVPRMYSQPSLVISLSLNKMWVMDVLSTSANERAAAKLSSKPVLQRDNFATMEL
mmetsp:Transcript_2864/g.5059  ORF Transcript_2864/g.5059 Transcript_2864/m.5059 type:complete len:243 (-) Transcript_2864:4300-5028(-)